MTQGELRFGRVRLEFLRILQRAFSRIAPSVSSVKHAEVKNRMCTRKPRTGKRKLGIKLHRPLVKTHGFQTGIGVAKGEMEACIKRQAAQIRIVSLRIICWF